MIPDNLLPDPYQSQAYIAGGYAACPSLASDIDIFVLAPSPHVSMPEPNDLRVIVHLQQVREVLLKHIHATQPKWRVTEQQCTRNQQGHAVYYNRNHCVLKVALIEGLTKPRMQVLVTDAPDVHVLLSGFDVSTHQVALTAAGVIRGRDWSPLHTPPIAINPNESTPARMKKIAERYGHLHGTKV